MEKCLLLPKMTVFGQSDHLTASSQARTGRPTGGGQARQQQDERRAERAGRARNRGDGPAWWLLRARDPGHPSQASPVIKPARPPAPQKRSPAGQDSLRREVDECRAGWEAQLMAPTWENVPAETSAINSHFFSE